jgi:hypothetical protein
VRDNIDIRLGERMREKLRRERREIGRKYRGGRMKVRFEQGSKTKIDRGR